MMKSILPGKPKSVNGKLTLKNNYQCYVGLSNNNRKSSLALLNSTLGIYDFCLIQTYFFTISHDQGSLICPKNVFQLKLKYGKI